MSMSKIQSLRLAAVLEDCSDQLDILGDTLRLPAGREQGTAAIQERTRLTKLRRECQNTQQVVYKLHVELEQSQSFTSLLLQEELEAKRRREKEAEEKRKEAAILKQAEKELEERKQHLQRQQEELQESTQKLKDMEDLYRQRSMEADYAKIMDKYSELQLSKTQKQLSQAEEHLEEQLRLLQAQMEEENKLHDESKKCLEQQHKDLQQELQELELHTKQMLELKDEQLDSAFHRRAVLKNKLTELRKKLKEIEAVVMKDREEQAQLRKERAEAGAAVKIQAWWRDCMVRKGFVKSEKADEKSKGKKGKGGKKKK